ncbi:MAG: protein phosphatase 2C domain-containing protein [Bdellovibrionales bacterium]|nr:protein phosphatase 2C domain-containing protein [Bdellovibrionales bacterium]
MSQDLTVISLPNGRIDQPQSFSLSNGNAAYFIAPSSERSKENLNQDSLLILDMREEGIVLCVADGLGGARGGDQASRIALESLQESVLSSAGKEPLRARIINGFESANQRILDLGIGAGSTLVVVEVGKESFRAYTVGDSEVLVMGQKGVVLFSSLPQSPVGYAVESGMIEPQAAIFHSDRHIVSSVLGSNEMHIHLHSEMPLKERDTVVLATDGVFDNVFREEVVESVRSGSLLTGLESLVSLTQKRMTAARNGKPSKPDDVAVIVFRRTP